MINDSNKGLRILRVRQAAELLNVSQKTIYDWVHKDLIPHYKPTPGTILFVEEEVINWFKSTKRGPQNRMGFL